MDYDAVGTLLKKKKKNCYSIILHAAMCFVKYFEQHFKNFIKTDDLLNNNNDSKNKI